MYIVLDTFIANIVTCACGCAYEVNVFAQTGPYKRKPTDSTINKKHKTRFNITSILLQQCMKTKYRHSCTCSIQYNMSHMRSISVVHVCTLDRSVGVAYQFDEGGWEEASSSV
jgi:beta-xylosidase